MRMDVASRREGRHDHSRARSLARRRIDQDEGAGRPIVRIGVEGNGLQRFDVREPDVVEREGVGRCAAQCGDIGPMLQRQKTS